MTSPPHAEVASIQVGLPRTIEPWATEGPSAKPWTSGIFKEPVPGPVWLGRTNLAGDAQADLKNHGGPNKAVNVYPGEHYRYWAPLLGGGPLPPAAFGENFTTAGLVEAEVCLGDVFQVAEAVVQVSQPRQPCWKLARRWGVKDLALRVQQTGRTGWYFRVLQEGHVYAGASLVRIERPHPEWTVAAANAVMHAHTPDREAARALAHCPALSLSWRETLLRRAADETPASPAARLRGPED